MAAGNFEKCLPIILHFEGGRSSDPADPGGRTNKGITQKTYDAYRTRLGHPPNDVYAITNAEVADCYRHDYWDAIGGDTLRPGEDLAVFDFAVNSGPARALHALKALNLQGLPLVEPNLTAAIIRVLCSDRLTFMRSLSTWPHFGSGWARRVAQVQQYGLAMAAGKAPAPPKVKPHHAGDAVIVAGGAAAGLSYWLGSPLVLTGAIVFAAIALACYIVVAAARTRQMAAAKARVPPVTVQPGPLQAPAPDPIEAAVAKIAVAKGALAVAVADAVALHEALIKHGVDLQADIAAAEARLAAMGVDVAAQPGAQEQGNHAFIAASPLDQTYAKPR